MKKWYVFDQYDCINEFNSVAGAAELALDLSKEGHTGIHIAFMTQKEFLGYCSTGKFPFSEVTA